MNPPNKLLVVSDSNELELIETTKANASKKTEAMFVYRYSKSKNKFQSNLSVTEKQLQSMISKGHFKTI